MTQALAQKSYRTLLLSDLHIGSFRCKADRLAEFLSRCQAQTIILVGDVFDFWSFRGGGTWSADHARLVAWFHVAVSSGSRLIVIPGNHDSALASFANLEIPGLEFHNEFIHETANGERFLVVHGHEHDEVLIQSERIAPILCALSERMFGAFRSISRSQKISQSATQTSRASWIWMRRAIGGVHRSEVKLIDEARRRRLDGVICGHTHIPSDFVLDGTRYLNCGDWVGNCTAITESWSGELELQRWVGQSEHCSLAGSSRARRRRRLRFWDGPRAAEAIS